MWMSGCVVVAFDSEVLEYVFLARTQLAHSSQNTADMELVGSTRVLDDFFNVLFFNLIVFTSEISLTVALIVRDGICQVQYC